MNGDEAPRPDEKYHTQATASSTKTPEQTLDYWVEKWDATWLELAASRAELAALQQRIDALMNEAEARDPDNHHGLVDTRGLRAALAAAATPPEPEPSSAELERMLSDPDGATIVRGAE